MSIKNEISRKAIHIFSSIFPVMYYFIDKGVMINIMGIICSICLIFDIIRLKMDFINKFFLYYFSFLTRSFEKNSLLGSSYFTLGCLLTILISSKETAITAMFVLIISDTCASICGMTIKSRKLIGNKSLSGYIAFLISAIIISFISSIIFKVSFMLFILPVIFASLLELYSKKIRIDDNLLIPIGFAILTNLFI